MCCPAAPRRCAVPERHAVNGNRIVPPFPEGMKLALFGLGCFWGAERKFWQVPGVYSTAVGYAAGSTPNPTYEEVCSGYTGAQRSRARRVRPAQGQLRNVAEDVLGIARSDAGHASGQRRRHAVSLGHLCLRRRAARGRGGEPEELRRAAEEGRSRCDHDRDPRRAGVLLRRGLSPAVPAEESGWVLRAGRMRSFVRSR